jgi:hypothetical protein
LAPPRSPEETTTTTTTTDVPGSGSDDDDRRRDDDDDDDRTGDIFGVMFGERAFASGIADAEEAAESFFGEGREFSERPPTDTEPDRTGSETFEFGDELY